MFVLILLMYKMCTKSATILFTFYQSDYYTKAVGFMSLWNFPATVEFIHNSDFRTKKRDKYLLSVNKLSHTFVFYNSLLNKDS